MRYAFEEMTNTEKTKFMYTCLNECIIDEWRNIYLEVIDFVYIAAKMWYERL